MHSILFYCIYVLMHSILFFHIFHIHQGLDLIPHGYCGPTVYDIDIQATMVSCCSNRIKDFPCHLEGGFYLALINSHALRQLLIRHGHKIICCTLVQFVHVAPPSQLAVPLTSLYVLAPEMSSFYGICPAQAGTWAFLPCLRSGGGMEVPAVQPLIGQLLGEAGKETSGWPVVPPTSLDMLARLSFCGVYLAQARGKGKRTCGTTWA